MVSLFIVVFPREGGWKIEKCGFVVSSPRNVKCLLCVIPPLTF